MSIQGYWADVRAPAFRNLPRDLVAVLPTGAIEQHGPHLPLSVDRDLVNAVVTQALCRLDADQNVLVLPTLAITKSGEHDRHPGTLSLSAQTLLATLNDIGASVARAGVERLVLFNGHGGNTAALEIAARDMRIAHDMIVTTCSWFGFADMEGLSDTEKLAHDLHGGEIETSAMLFAKPETVDTDQVSDFKTVSEDWAGQSPFIGLTGQPARPAWIIDDLNTQGVCGDASAATAAKGQHLIESAGRSFAAFLAEFAVFDHRWDGP